MGEGNYALRLGKTKRVGVGASVVGVVASLAVVTVLANRAVPDGVGRVELFTEATAVWEGKGSSRSASRHFLVMILWHGKPSETVVTGIVYCRSYSHSSSAHFFWSVVIGNEGAVIKVWVQTRNNPGLGEAASSFSISNPPACPFIS